MITRCGIRPIAMSLSLSLLLNCHAENELNLDTGEIQPFQLELISADWALVHLLREMTASSAPLQSWIHCLYACVRIKLKRLNRIWHLGILTQRIFWLAQTWKCQAGVKGRSLWFVFESSTNVVDLLHLKQQQNNNELDYSHTTSKLEGHQSLDYNMIIMPKRTCRILSMIIKELQGEGTRTCRATMLSLNRMKGTKKNSFSRRRKTSPAWTWTCQCLYLDFSFRVTLRTVKAVP